MKTMRFSIDTETDYQMSLGDEKIRTTRIASLIALVLFLLFGILDIWAIPSALLTVWAIRLTIAVLIVVILFLTWREKFFLKHYTAITIFQYLSFGGAIEIMIYFSNPDEIARFSYYAGLLLVIMALYSWTFSPANLAATIGLTIVVSYNFIAAGYQNVRFPLLMANGFFLSGANVIGFIAHQERDRCFRKNYLLRRSLYRELKLADIAKQQSEFLALHDPLTGLPNRLYLKRAIAEMIEVANEDGSAVAVLFIDLDGFKPINDKFGHEIGDLVLHALSRRLETCVRYGDTVARLGGDEFVVVWSMPVNNVDKNIQVLAKRLLFTLSRPVVVKSHKITLLASIGVSVYPYHGQDAETLITMADKHMYAIKRTGKNGVCVAALPG